MKKQTQNSRRSQENNKSKERQEENWFENLQKREYFCSGKKIDEKREFREEQIESEQFQHEWVYRSREKIRSEEIEAVNFQSPRGIRYRSNRERN